MSEWRPASIAATGGTCTCWPTPNSGRCPIHRVASEAATKATAVHESCGRCGAWNVSWAAPSPLWNLVMRGGSINGNALFGDLVCIGCFVDLARQQGIAGRWRITVSPEPGGLETTTPSGRTWNPETWLWDEPLAAPVPVVGEAL